MLEAAIAASCFWSDVAAMGLVFMASVEKLSAAKLGSLEKS